MIALRVVFLLLAVLYSAVIVGRMFSQNDVWPQHFLGFAIGTTGFIWSMGWLA